MNRLAIIAVWISHAFLLWLMAVAIPWNILFEPWYVAVPVALICIRILYSRDGVCPLNDLENALRRAAGLPEIKGFITHYIFRNAAWREQESR